MSAAPDQIRQVATAARSAEVPSAAQGRPKQAHTAARSAEVLK